MKLYTCPPASPPTPAAAPSTSTGPGPEPPHSPPPGNEPPNSLPSSDSRPHHPDDTGKEQTAPPSGPRSAGEGPRLHRLDKPG